MCIEGGRYSLPCFDDEHVLQEADCMVPVEQSKVIEAIDCFERAAILIRREEMIVQNEIINDLAHGKDGVSSSSTSIVEEGQHTKSTHGQVVEDVVSAPEIAMQYTLSETLVEEDEEYFPKGYALTFSITDAYLAATQVEETQVEEQDIAGGYRIEFISHEDLLAFSTQSSNGRGGNTAPVEAVTAAAVSTTETRTVSEHLVTTENSSNKAVDPSPPSSDVSKSNKPNFTSPDTSISTLSNSQSTLQTVQNTQATEANNKQAPTLENTLVPTPPTAPQERSIDKKDRKTPATDQQTTRVTRSSASAQSTPIQPRKKAKKSSMNEDGYASDSSTSSVVTRSKAASVAKHTTVSSTIASPKSNKRGRTEESMDAKEAIAFVRVQSALQSLQTNKNSKTNPASPAQQKSSKANKDERREHLVGRKVKKFYSTVGMINGVIVDYQK